MNLFLHLKTKRNSGFVSIIALLLAVMIILVLVYMISGRFSGKNNNQGETTPIDQAKELRDKANQKYEENQKLIEENENNH